MKLSVAQIWKRIEMSGIADANLCREWSQNVAATFGDSAVEQPEVLLRSLIKANKLTRFEGQCLASNTPARLRIGRFRIKDRIVWPGLSNLSLAIEPETGNACFLWSIEIDRDESKIDDRVPSIERARALSSIRSESVPEYSSPFVEAEAACVTMAWSEGAWLNDFLAGYPHGTTQSQANETRFATIVEAVAQLHRSSIVHGFVHPSVVRCDLLDDKCKLVVDPFFDRYQSPNQLAELANDKRLEAVLSDLRYFSAPESWLLGFSPSFTSDVYSLGCLWYRLLCGHSPFSNADPSALESMVVNARLELKGHCEVTEVYERVFSHAVAKNPSARFANASVFKEALRHADTSRKPQTQLSGIETQPTPSVPIKPSVAATAVVKVDSVPPQAVPPVAVELSARKSVSLSKPEPAVVSKASKNPPQTPEQKKKGRTTSKRKSKPKRPIWLLPSMLAGCVVLLGSLVWLLSPSNDSRVAVESDQSRNESAATTQTRDTKIVDATASTDAISPLPTIDPMEDEFTISPSASDVPWLPPHPPKPYSLAMLPPGAQGLIFIKPGNWVANASWPVLADNWQDTIAASTPMLVRDGLVEPNSISEFAIGVYGGRSDGWPRLVFRLALQEKVNRDEWLKKVQPSSAKDIDGQSIHQRNGEWFYLGESERDGQVEIDSIVCGPEDLMVEVASARGAIQPLRRQFEQLWQASDADADFTAILATAVLFADARNILPMLSPPIQIFATEFLDRKTQAFLFTTSLEPSWYLEWRGIGNNNEDNAEILRVLKETVKRLPDDFESAINRAPTDAYWRALANRFPAMLRKFGKYHRLGVENGQAILNAYLPATAAPNMVLASWLSARGLGTATIASAPSAATTGDKSIKPIVGEALLDFPVDIAFDQEPLDLALNAIAEELDRALPEGSPKIEVTIDGKAFELAGVTRNQQIRDFRFKATPLRQILSDIAGRLNPDRTVTSLTETKQAVVWLLITDGAQSRIQFSTRAAAATQNISLSKEFKASAPN